VRALPHISVVRTPESYCPQKCVHNEKDGLNPTFLGMVIGRVVGDFFPPEFWNLTFFYKIFNKKVCFLGSEWENEISPLLSPLETSTFGFRRKKPFRGPCSLVNLFVILQVILVNCSYPPGRLCDDLDIYQLNILHLRQKRQSFVVHSGTKPTCNGLGRDVAWIKAIRPIPPADAVTWPTSLC